MCVAMCSFQYSAVPSMSWLPRKAGSLMLLLLAVIVAGPAAHAAEASRVSGDPAAAPGQSTPTKPSSSIRPHLQVTGLKDPDLLRNVGLSVPPVRFGCDAAMVTARRYLKDARLKAEQGLRALGYFNAVIHSRLTRENGCLQPLLAIEPGPPTKVTQVAIDLGDAGPVLEKQDGFARWLADARPKLGSVLNQDNYRHLRDDLLSRVRSQGFLDARWKTHELRVDPETRTAQYHLQLDAGQRYRFGSITIRQSLLRPTLANNLMGVKSGDPYTAAALVQISQNLMSSGYFSDVRVRPRLKARANGQVPVVVRTELNPRTSYEFRVGYGTDTGARIGAKIHRRYSNDRGHHWTAGVSLSQRQQTLNATYSIPREKDPLNQRYDIYAVVDREENSGIRTLSSRTGAQWVRNFNRWTTSLFSEYLVERSQYGDAPASTRHFWLFGARAGLQRLDDPLFPTRGFVLSTELSTAARPLLSSASLLRGRVLLGGLYPIGNWILKGRVEAGAIDTNNFDDIPKTLRFFAGGDQSVRGYAYESLGPTDSTGQVIGGQYLLVGSAEIMHPLETRNWYIAAFVDHGNAFNNVNDMALKTGAGLGVRWRSPIGAVRIDIAYPFNGTSHTPRLHLGIGAAF